MFPRTNRLSSKDVADFWRKRGVKRQNTPLFTVYCASNGLGYNRCTVVVGSKIDRRAVKRNTIKRRLRALLAVHIRPARHESVSDSGRPAHTKASLGRPGFGKDVVVVALPKIRNVAPKEVVALVAETMSQLLHSP